MNTSSNLSIPGANPLSFSHRARIENTPSFYYVESGCVDLYCLISYQGALLPYFLLSIQEGEWIYPFISLLKPYVQKTYFEARPQTKLLEVPSALLENKIKEDPSFSPFFLESLLNYITKLSRIYLFSAQKEADLELSEQEELTLGEKHTFRLRKGRGEKLTWLKVHQGLVRLLHHPFEFSLEEGSSLPLLREFQFESVEKSRIETFSYQKVIQKETLFSGLAAFQKWLLGAAYESKIAQLKNEKNLHEMKALLNQQIFQESIFEIQSLLQKDSTTLKTPSTYPLLNAYMMLARYLKIDFTLPSQLEFTYDLETDIQTISRVLQIPFRKVHLDPHWYKNPSIPLLSFVGEAKKPIVLLPSMKSRYEMVDPMTQKREIVVKKMVPAFSDEAYAFYPALPDTIQKPLDLLRFLFKNHIPLVQKAFLFALLGSIFSLIPILLIQFFVNTIVPLQGESLLMEGVIILLLSGISLTGLHFFATHFITRISGLSNHLLQTGLIHHLFRSPWLYVHEESFGELIIRMQSALLMSLSIQPHLIVTLLKGALSLILFIPMFYYDWLIALILLGLTVGCGFLSLIFFSLKTNFLIEQNALLGKSFTVLTNAYRAIKKIRFKSLEFNILLKWGDPFWTSLRKFEKGQHAQLGIHLLGSLFPLAAIGIYLSALLFRVRSLEDVMKINLGQFLALFFAILLFSDRIKWALFSMGSLADALSYFKTAQPIMKAPIEKDKKKVVLEGEIRFIDVLFHYPTKASPIFHSLNFTIKKGEFVAICGEKISGKTTLIRLLLGLVNPQKGAIYYDQHNLATLDLETLQAQVSAILENDVFIQGTLYENLISNRKTTKRFLEEVLQFTGFYKDLYGLEKGLNTPLNQLGEPFSLGQRQKLLLTRSLLKKPSLYLFDEPTSALMISEQKDFWDYFQRLLGTKIVVTHHPFIMKKADRILVLKEGKIAEEGTFEELIQVDGELRNILGLSKVEAIK